MPKKTNGSRRSELSICCLIVAWLTSLRKSTLSVRFMQVSALVLLLSLRRCQSDFLVSFLFIFFFGFDFLEISQLFFDFYWAGESVYSVGLDVANFRMKLRPVSNFFFLSFCFCSWVFSNWILFCYRIFKETNVAHQFNSARKWIDGDGGTIWWEDANQRISSTAIWLRWEAMPAAEWQLVRPSCSATIFLGIERCIANCNSLNSCKLVVAETTAATSRDFKGSKHRPPTHNSTIIN